MLHALLVTDQGNVVAGRVGYMLMKDSIASIFPCWGNRVLFSVLCPIGKKPDHFYTLIFNFRNDCETFTTVSFPNNRTFHYFRVCLESWKAVGHLVREFQNAQCRSSNEWDCHILIDLDPQRLDNSRLWRGLCSHWCCCQAQKSVFRSNGRPLRSEQTYHQYDSHQAQYNQTGWGRLDLFYKWPDWMGGALSDSDSW